MRKHKLLEEFIRQYDHLPNQGTDEWKELRKDFIGGSEISTVLKQNKNKTVNKLILEKLGFKPFVGNVITHWGNVFEEFIRLHCEERFACTIRETGSIPYKNGYLSYSPDGLAVVPSHKLKEELGCVDPKSETSDPSKLVLFEFKCPHSRVATTDIPEHYLPQVSIGMNIIDIMETAIFVQATYRRCAFSELRYDTTHNPIGHFKRADTSDTPVEYGFMVVYANEPSEFIDNLVESLIEIGNAEEIHLLNGHALVDVGTMNHSGLLEEVLGKCVNKTFSIDYCFRQRYIPSVFGRGEYVTGLYNKSIEYQARKILRRQTETHNTIVCVIPFKLLNVHLTLVEKNPRYIEDSNAHSRAKCVLECIDAHRGLVNEAEVAKSVRRCKL
jgi:hypothetical protein